MSKMLNPLTLGSAGFAIAAGFALIAATGPADAASKRMCETNSLKRTTSCCEAYLRKTSETWGNSSGASCNAGTTVVCKKVSPQTSTAFAGAGSGKVCYVVLRKKPNDRDSKNHEQPSPNTPGTNTRDGGLTAGNTKP
jgi:hypothetical protein